MGALVFGLAALICFEIWRAGFNPDETAMQWRQNGRYLLDCYRWIGGVLFWGGALLWGATGVSEERIGATWEHLLLCPFGGRGLACGKIASGAAFLLVSQLALSPVLLVAGSCFGASPVEVGTVMLSHLLLTVQGATLGFWGALRGQTLLEGIVESLGAIIALLFWGLLVPLVGACLLTVLNAFLRVLLLLPIGGLGKLLVFVPPLIVGVWVILSRSVLSLVAGITGIGVPLLSAPTVNEWLLPLGIFIGQIVGIALFLKWSAWEIDYPTRDFWPRTSKETLSRPIVIRPTPLRPPAVRSAPKPTKSVVRSAVPRLEAPRLDPMRPMPASSSRGFVPPPFEEIPPTKGPPPLFGASSASPDKPRPLFEPPAIPLLPPALQTTPSPIEKTASASQTEKPFTTIPPVAKAPRDFAANSDVLPRTRVLYGVWNWELSPSQLSAFPQRERRDTSAKPSAMLPTWEETFEEPSATQTEDGASKRGARRMRAPVSRRWQEWNPVLWLDLTRCLSLRSPDSSMVPVLLSLGAVGGSFVLAVGMFLLVGWIQNALGGSRGDVSSLASTWGDLHWILWWGALVCGPIWGATGYVVERRTGMLVELRLTLISARALWWGKFGARFLIPASLSLPLLAMVAFFAWNWPDKNAPFEVTAALVDCWALAAWSLLACLWISDSTRRELSAGLWCGAFALVWGCLLWNFPTFSWTPIHLVGATLAGGHLLLRLKRLGFG